MEGRNILISSQQPPKIRIPVQEKQNIDVTLDAAETVKQFEDRIVESCKEVGVNTFKLLLP